MCIPRCRYPINIRQGGKAGIATKYYDRHTGALIAGFSGLFKQAFTRQQNQWRTRRIVCLERARHTRRRIITAANVNAKHLLQLRHLNMSRTQQYWPNTLPYT